MTIPKNVRRVIVYGDRGLVAERLLVKARDHFAANGRELISHVPDCHEDWNDACRAVSPS
ncbi:toprim domain-containing protein (plasmid) [Sphingomonadaceae bacterium OTU29MARTA1]|nr:toprim domain-containing protein [Sphingomonadaceae bacterium OTU29MARTA1]